MSEPWTDEIWHTRDGRVLTVAEMDEAHVRDALRMLLRAQRRRKAIRAMKAQIEKAMLDDMNAQMVNDFLLDKGA